MLGSSPLFFASLKALISFLTSLKRDFFSFLDNALNSLNADLIVAESGSPEGNELFTESYQVPNVLFRTNYGEQFFNETGQPVDLSHLGQFFNEDFFQKI